MICDEITSSLDVSVQAAVVELLVDLQRSNGTAYLFITHDLNLVRQIAHRIAVMYRGELVELLDVDDLATTGPRHPYTRQLHGRRPATPGRTRHDSDRPQTPCSPSLDEKACLDFLSAMVRHKSYSQTEGERTLAEFMAEQHARARARGRAEPVEGTRVNAIGRWKGTGGGKSLLFNGHLDTNPATEGWTVDPWGGLVDDKFIYGIGVSNMKAGDAAYFCAVEDAASTPACG